MGFKLTPIDVVDDISREEFVEKYLKPRRPLVIRNMIAYHVILHRVTGLMKIR